MSYQQHLTEQVSRAPHRSLIDQKVVDAYESDSTFKSPTIQRDGDIANGLYKIDDPFKHQRGFNRFEDMPADLMHTAHLGSARLAD